MDIAPKNHTIIYKLEVDGKNVRIIRYPRGFHFEVFDGYDRMNGERWNDCPGELQRKVQEVLADRFLNGCTLDR